MKNVALHNLGCKVNAYEMDVMQQTLLEKGYKIVPFDEKADIYIVNTCSVTNIADRKSRQMLHRAKKKNPEAIVVATGCYVQTGEAEAQIDESIDLLIGNNKKKDLIEILEDYMSSVNPTKTLSHTTIIDINKTKEYEEMQLKKTAEHTRAYIKIQDGCNQFCSYCIIPYARGRVRSRGFEHIKEEIEKLAKNGYQEIVLTGIHISSYGVDQDSKRGLLELINEIHEVEGIKRIRLGSLEPRIITKEFAKVISQLPKICPHFHLSLQSGCDAVLKRMNRRYRTSEYYEKVMLLRKYFDNPAITTDVIVGFPGETEEEFLETKEFLEKISFAEMHIFKYSKRKGTVAAEMKEQVADNVKAKRSDMLLVLAKQQAKDFKDLYRNKEVEVLFEEEKVAGTKIYQVGYTKEYIKVILETKENLTNSIKKGIMSLNFNFG